MMWIVATIALVGLISTFTMIAYQSYNRLVELRNRCDQAFGQIEVQMQRRFDLIPNLVVCAERYLEHESATLCEVIQARDRASRGLSAASQDVGNAMLVQALLQSESALTASMERLGMVIEAYPDLRADATMQELSDKLTATEDRIAWTRQNYNDLVMILNTCRQSFPTVMVASWIGFSTDRPMLQFSEQQNINATPAVMLA